MCSHITLRQMLLGSALGLFAISNVYALDEPNGNYSSQVLAYRSSTLPTPVCIGGECHAELSGPAVLF